jgi:hypothetical protein
MGEKGGEGVWAICALTSLILYINLSPPKKGEVQIYDINYTSISFYGGSEDWVQYLAMCNLCIYTEFINNLGR